MSLEKPKQYIVQKLVMANSVIEAIAKEPSTPVNSVFPSEKQPDSTNVHAVGFQFHTDTEETL